MSSRAPIRILICGGRTFSKLARLRYVVESLIRNQLAAAGLDSQLDFDQVWVVHGNAIGADRLAGATALALGCTVIAVPANWWKYPKAGGPIRNQRMLDQFEPNVVLAFSGGKGTANMVELARKRKIDVIDYSTLDAEQQE